MCLRKKEERNNPPFTNKYSPFKHTSKLALAQEMELRRQQAELIERERAEKRMEEMVKREEDEKLCPLAHFQL